MAEIILRIYGCMGKLYKWLGVDREAFLSILKVKLTLDDRRVWTGVHTHQAKRKSRSFQITLLVYGFFGIFMGLMLLWVESPFTAMTFINSFIMFVVGFTLVADFTRVLLDTRDNVILLPRPVGDRTLLAVRIAHIVTYLALLSLSLSACALVTGAVKYHPLFPLLYLCTLLCLLCLVVFFVFLFYMLAMRLFDVERFRDIILYFQILLTVFFIGAYQVLPRLMDMEELEKLTLVDAWWIYVYPPAWTAAPFDLLIGNAGGPQILLSLLGILTPMAGIVLVIRVLAPGFGRALSAGEIESAAPSKKGDREGPGLPLAGRLGKRFARQGEERAAFHLLWRLSSRDRALKLAVYPQIVFVFMFFFVFVMSKSEGILESLKTLNETENHLIILYAVNSICPVVLTSLRYSNRFEAAWCYYALPLKYPGSMLAAALKVAVIRFTLPLFLIIVIPCLALWGMRIVPDIVLSFLVMLIISIVFARNMTPRLPFSEIRVVKQDTGQTVKFLLFFFLLAILGFGHFGLTHVPYGVPAAAVVALILIPFAYRGYDRISWWKIKHV